MYLVVHTIPVAKSCVKKEREKHQCRCKNEPETVSVGAWAIFPRTDGEPARKPGMQYFPGQQSELPWLNVQFDKLLILIKGQTDRMIIRLVDNFIRREDLIRRRGDWPSLWSALVGR